jgi:hypothetical protein
MRLSRFSKSWCRHPTETVLHQSLAEVMTQMHLPALACLDKRCFSSNHSRYVFYLPVLRIHDILVWIWTQIRGSMPLTNGSGSGSRRPKNMWIRIQEAQKQVDPDPQHSNKYVQFITQILWLDEGRRRPKKNPTGIKNKPFLFMIITSVSFHAAEEHII